jgi:hypothetical protein
VKNHTTAGAVVPHTPLPDFNPGAKGPLDVLVLPQRNLPAHPKEAANLSHMPIERVLNHHFDSDAHFVQYQSPIHQRLSRKSLAQGIYPTMVISAFDVDCEEAHKSRAAASDGWWATEYAKVYELMSHHPGGAHYRTRGGYRLIFNLSEPLVITSAVGERRWSTHYLVAVNYLRREFDIVADSACKEWGRLYRAPHVIRPPSGGAQ